MNVIVADDHPIVRRGLQQIIESQQRWKVAAEVATCEDVLPVLRRIHADVLLLDISFGGRSGIDLIAGIRAEFPSLPILILSMYSQEQYAIHCLRAGASGYLQKDSSPEEILDAIRRVAAGQTYMSEEVANRLALEFVRKQTAAPHERLSTREFEVFRLLASGKSVTEIATILHVSVKTVSTYRARVLDKTGLRGNAEIVAYAIRSGLL